MAAAAPLRNTPQSDESDRRDSLAGRGVIPIKATIQIRPSNLAPTTAISPGALSPPTPTLCNGPASGTTTILPRPKPGRKPASDEPENKRKAQNRAAQRAFRERKLQGQQQLEVENKDLKFVNEQLAKEIQQHRDSIASGQAIQSQLEVDLSESIRRENELRVQHERNLSTMAAFEQRMHEAERKTSQYLNELHTLRAEAAILRAKLGKPQRQIIKSDGTVQDSAPTPPVTNPINGCDDCGKDGTCPCVDSYLQSDDTPSKDDETNHRQPMSLETILSSTDSTGSVRLNSIPELVSDHSSPEDMEIDFTHAFKQVTQARSIPKTDKCGFCEDGGKCICAEAEAEISMSLAHNVPLAPVTKTSKPGTCLQCQKDPKQKAYCESLARTRVAARGSAEGEPAAKRSRLSQRDVQVPCSDAYAIYKRYSSSNKAPSYDEIYQEYVKAHPGSRRGAAAAKLNSESRQRQFSAYETDIAAVIATLHRQDPKGSKSSEHAKT